MIFKKITKAMAFVWVFSLCIYSSVLIGTLAHELMHKSYAKNITAIEIKYDGAGKAYGAFFRHSHEWVFLNGYIVETFLILISLICMIIILC